MILLLALAGAGVDAVVIMGFNVLTAAQTGNTILLAVALAEERLAVGFSAAVSVIGYVIGAAAGELLLVRGARTRARAAGFAGPLLTECVLLGGVVVLWSLSGNVPLQGAVVVLVLLAALAMGMQSVVVLRLHAGSTTTYITGMLTTFTAGVIRRLVIGAGEVSTAASEAVRNDRGSDSPWASGLTWVVYTAGAIGCGLLFLQVGEAALLVPIASVAAAAVLSQPPTPQAANPQTFTTAPPRATAKSPTEP